MPTFPAHFYTPPHSNPTLASSGVSRCPRSSTPGRRKTTPTPQQPPRDCRAHALVSLAAIGADALAPGFLSAPSAFSSNVLQCHRLSAHSLIMEGPFFRTPDHHELTKVVPTLRFWPGPPWRIKILVETLHDLGEITGVTGDTNGGPALKTTNWGLPRRRRRSCWVIVSMTPFVRVCNNITAVMITFVSTVTSERSLVP